MKTLTLLSLLVLASLTAACGGGGGLYDPYYIPGGGSIWLFKPGAPVGEIDIQNAPVTEAGLPNERLIPRITVDGQPLEGVTVAPGATFTLHNKYVRDHFLEFEFDDGTRATSPEPEAPIRVEVGQKTPIVVTY